MFHDATISGKRRQRWGALDRTDLDATPGRLIAAEVEGCQGAVVQQHDPNRLGVILVQLLPG